MLFALFSLAAAVAASPLEARAACNADNLLRCLKATPSLASPYCVSVISQVIETVTTTPTVTAATITEGVSQVALAKRAISSTISPPRCVTVGTSYSPARISSACSCFVPATSTSMVTAVVATATVYACATPQAASNGGFEATDDNSQHWTFDPNFGSTGVKSGIATENEPTTDNHFA